MIGCGPSNGASKPGPRATGPAPRPGRRHGPGRKPAGAPRRSPSRGARAIQSQRCRLRVRSIIQRATALGIAWVAAVGGAAAFSSRAPGAEGTWRVYLYANEVNALAARGEEIWAGTTGGLLRVEASGRVTQWNRASQGLLSDTLAALAVDGAGRVWCGTEKVGISVYDPADLRWSSVTSLQQPIPGDEIRRVRFSGAGDAESLLVAGRQGYAVLVSGDLRAACLDGVDICDIPSYDVHDLLPFEGELWLATARGAVSARPAGDWIARSAGLGNAGLHRLARAGGLYVSGSVPRAPRDSIWTWTGEQWQALPRIPGAPSVYRVHEMLGAGDTLFAAVTGGVHRWIEGAWSPVGEVSVWAPATGDTVEITSLARTASGRLFAGASHRGERRDGIWELSGNTWRQHRQDGPSLRQSYRSAFFDSRGALWLSAAQRGRPPHVLRFQSGVWTLFNGNESGRSNDWTWRMREVGGEIWLAHCCCTDVNRCGMERIRADESFQAWPIHNARDLDVDGEGRLWIATTGADVNFAYGVYRMDPADSTWIQVRTSTPGARLLSDQVSAIRCDGRSVWIGYEDFGVSRWDLGGDGRPLTVDDVWTRFHEDDATRPLIGNAIRRIEVAPDGRVWIGTTAGLSIWNGERFTNVGAGFGRLPTPNVNDVIPLDDGGAWVATRGGGLTRLRPREQGGFFYEVFGPPDIPNPNVEALALSPDGRTLWLATERGLAAFLPAEVSDLVAGPRIGAYPNPYRPGCVDGLRLLGTGGGVRGVVADLAGRVVARFPRDGAETQDSRDPIWDGTEGGRPVAPGLYWIRVQTARGERSLGVAVVDGACPP